MIYVASYAGEGKNISEDSVIVGSDIVTNAYQEFPMLQKGFVCVADGVGGNKAGEIASSFVLQSLISYNGTDDLKAFIQSVNQNLIQKSMESTEYEKMATTLSGVYLNEEIAFLIHVGNTRVYLGQGQYLKQLTDDHTVYRLLHASGKTEEAERCNQSAITNCLGGGDVKYADRLSISPLPAFNRLLLTSDGIHEYISIDDMETILNDSTPEGDKCKRIVQYARRNGSKDDMTVVIIVK